MEKIIILIVLITTIIITIIIIIIIKAVSTRVGKEVDSPYLKKMP